MNKSFKNIGTSILLVTLLTNNNSSFAIYTIVDDDVASVPAFVAQDASKPSPSEKPVIAAVPDITHLEEINSAKNAPPKIKNKKSRLSKKHIARCPSELSCGGGDTKPVNYTIPFVKARTSISEASKKRLNALLPRIKGTRVCIIGRPDFVTYMNGNKSTLATSRAYNIRNYLIQNGVPAESITVTAKAEPYTNDDGSSFSSDLIVLEKKESIIKHKVHLLGIEKAPFIKNISNLDTNSLQRENAKVSLINSNAAIMNFINVAVKNGSITEAAGNQLKEKIKFNEIRVIKSLSYSRPI